MMLLFSCLYPVKLKVLGTQISYLVCLPRTVNSCPNQDANPVSTRPLTEDLVILPQRPVMSWKLLCEKWVCNGITSTHVAFKNRPYVSANTEM